ncbi:MAG: hypothetical protein JJU41_09570 [Bacteroidetes bacterium]|nr:hypothetical protein [Bacteroidota bacterium]
MHKITLLSSFHKNLGKCNPDELYKIIEELQPEVIFEELDIDTFSHVYSDNYTPNSVESITIKNYLKQNSIKHYPVDTYPVNESNLLSDAQIIWDYSKQYRELWNKKIFSIRQDGYSFINSNDCVELIDKIRLIEKTVLLEMNNVKLLNELKKERELHDKRENEMLKNIYKYSKEYLFGRAIFLCGVEHRNPLKKKIQEYEAKEELRLKWTFYNNT